MQKTPQTSLLKWYARRGRHTLPWRNTRDPYRIYLSEIMLQQTQVATVLERFYFPFLEKFPTLLHVAQAPLDEVLKQWEGLGYYTRARNLHHTAQACKGQLPTTIEALIALKGIGRSTAHAIGAFAFGIAVPILDANVRRVLHRYFGIESRDEKGLWAAAYALLDTQHPYEYNQAMMDLGAMVCIKSTPKCDDCPLHEACIGKESNPLAYPAPKPKKSAPTHHLALLVYRHEGRLGLVQRTTRLLQGLWGFVQAPIDNAIEGVYLGRVSHQYSHFGIEGEVRLIDGWVEGLEWFEVEALETLALSTLDHKILACYLAQ
ncbi:MAG: adenine glycosylase [Sulfuricurvum sp. PC08-66]|nr:MAG: adenine glycosylase [Sulfuricurvum sp. PC08-66]